MNAELLLQSRALQSK